VDRSREQRGQLGDERHRSLLRTAPVPPAHRPGGAVR
jgi:hypothetical protein